MLYTKVKIFQSVVSISPGDSSQQGDFQQLEDQIDQFLLDNPGAKPIEVKLTSSAAPVGNTVTNCGLIARLIFQEAYAARRQGDDA